MFNVRRASTFAFEQDKRTAIDGRFIRVDKSRELPFFDVVEHFHEEPICRFAVTTWEEIKIDGAPPVVDESFRWAQTIVAGIELLLMIRKGQYQHLQRGGLPPAEQFYLLPA